MLHDFQRLAREIEGLDRLVRDFTAPAREILQLVETWTAWATPSHRVKAIHVLLAKDATNLERENAARFLARDLGIKNREAVAAMLEASVTVREEQRVRVAAMDSGHGPWLKNETGEIAKFVPAQELEEERFLMVLRALAYRVLRSKRKPRGEPRERPHEVRVIEATRPEELRQLEAEGDQRHDAALLVRRLERLRGRTGRRTVPPSELKLLAVRVQVDSCAEAARALGLSPNTGRQLMFRLRKRLKRPSVAKELGEGLLEQVRNL